MTIPLKVFSINELAGYLGGKMNTLGDRVLLCNDKRSLPAAAVATPFLFESMLFSVCTRGYARLLIDSREIEVKEGELLVVMPRKTIEVIESSCFRAFHLCLDKEILALSAIRISGFISIINKLHSNEPFRPERMEKDFLTATLDLIRNTLQNGGRHQEEIVIYLISSLFLFLDDMIADEVEKDCKHTKVGDYLPRLSAPRLRASQRAAYGQVLCRQAMPQLQTFGTDDKDRHGTVCLQSHQQLHHPAGQVLAALYG